MGVVWWQYGRRDVGMAGDGVVGMYGVSKTRQQREYFKSTHAKISLDVLFQRQTKDLLL